MKYRTKRILIVGFSLFVLAVLYTFKNYSSWLRSIAAIGFLVIFYMADHLFRWEFKHRHYFFAVFIAVTSFLLSPLYFIYPNYDKILHFVMPMMFASLVYHIVSRFNLRRRDNLIFTFFIVLGLLGIHEIGEYWLDYFFDLKLQGVFLRDLQGLEKFNILMDRIDDTMMDLTLGAIGTLIYVAVTGVIKRLKEKKEERKAKHIH